MTPETNRQTSRGWLNSLSQPGPEEFCVILLPFPATPAHYLNRGCPPCSKLINLLLQNPRTRTSPLESQRLKVAVPSVVSPSDFQCPSTLKQGDRKWVWLDPELDKTVGQPRGSPAPGHSSLLPPAPRVKA